MVGTVAQEPAAGSLLLGTSAERLIESPKSLNNLSMNVARTSMLSQITRTMDLPVTQAQLDNYYDGVLLQEAFPNLSPEEREFIKTGITDEEWEAAFSEQAE